MHNKCTTHFDVSNSHSVARIDSDTFPVTENLLYTMKLWIKFGPAHDFKVVEVIHLSNHCQCQTFAAISIHSVDVRRYESGEHIVSRSLFWAMEVRIFAANRIKNVGTFGRISLCNDIRIKIFSIPNGKLKAGTKRIRAQNNSKI